VQQQDIGNWRCQWRLEKREGDINACETPQDRLEWLKNTIPYEILEGEGNLLLNVGCDIIWDLVVGDSAVHFNNATATIGVGDSSTAAVATQTDLQAAVNKLYKAMEATYPTSAAQKATFKSSFGSAEANWVWNEWVVKATTCLNRKVEALGTKSSGTWTLETTITLS